MKPKTAIIIAIIIILAIKLILLLPNPAPSYEAYQTINQVTSIEETALPNYTDPQAWNGSEYRYPPLLQYLIALTTIFLSTNIATLLITNLAISTLPIVVYLLTKEITRKNNLAIIATISSAFIPTLYQTTTNTATTNTLAIPLLLLSYYYFIRLGKTPRYQTYFILSTALLLLTSPLSILLPIAMTLTLLITKIQKTRFSKSMAEATIYTTFLVLWGNVIIYKNTLLTHGLSAFINNTTTPITIPTLATLTGLLPLFAGTYAAYHYLSQEKNEAAHATTTLALLTTILLILRIIPFNTGILLLGTLLIILATSAFELYEQAKNRSRIPSIYNAGYILLALLFIITNLTPSLALGLEASNNTPTDQEIKNIQALTIISPEATVLAPQYLGYYLEHKGFTTITNNNALAKTNSKEIIERTNNLYTLNTEIAIISELNELEVNIFIPENNAFPKTRRCFEEIIPLQEVYRIRCVAQ